MKAMEEEAVLDVLCEACLAKVEGKLQHGGTLFDHRLDGYGFCQECSKRINAFFDEKMKGGARPTEADGNERFAMRWARRLSGQ